MIDTVHIVVCMKPVEGNFSSNALEHGVAGLNIDGCRIATGNEDLGDPARFYGADNSTRPEWHRPHMTDEVMAKKHEVSFERLQSMGRWPANVIHDGSDEVVGLFPETGKNTGGKGDASKSNGSNLYSGYESRENASLGGFGDTGSAARFFKQCEADNMKENEDEHG